VRSAARALDILELLARHPTSLPAPVIARMCEIPRSTTYALLATLQARGMVAPDADGRWSAGERLQTLTGAAPSLGEAIAVLDSFERGPERVDAGTVARRSGLDQARVERLLSVLEAESLVTREAGTFGLGARLALLVSRFEPLEELRVAARPVLADLRERSGETANLLVADGDAAVYIDQAGDPEDPSGNPWVGRRVSLADSACGHALAGEGAHTVADAIEPGVTAVACAIRGPSGYPAVISAIGPTARLRGAHLADVQGLAVAAAASVSSRFAALSRHAGRRPG
jgi:DNA-binding IclR family transcriptional regulator